MKKLSNNGQAEAIFLISIFILVFCILMLAFGCTNNQPQQATITSQDQTIASSDVTKPLPTGSLEIPRIALYWEKTTEIHSERKPWSDFLIKKLSDNLTVLDNAKDMYLFCSKYKDLDKPTKLKAWGELFVALAYYESGFKPTAQSVDVGTKENRDTWSIGLFQMSVVDIKNYKIQNMKYDFNDLLKAEPNIDLAVAIMTKQIDAKKEIVVRSGPYWATLYNGKYPKINEIKLRVQKYAGGCN